MSGIFLPLSSFFNINLNAQNKKDIYFFSQDTAYMKEYLRLLQLDSP